MNKEKYNQIIDEVYENYLENCLDIKWMKENFFYDGSSNHHVYRIIKESFIRKCKTDSDFSEKWGLNIEERELTREERIDLYAKEYTPGVRNKYEKPFDDFIDAKLKTRNIPTKLITLTYNNETIEDYE